MSGPSLKAITQIAKEKMNEVVDLKTEVRDLKIDSEEKQRTIDSQDATINYLTKENITLCCEVAELRNKCNWWKGKTMELTVSWIILMLLLWTHRLLCCARNLL